MEALALYLVKVHVSITLLYAIYYFTVRNEGFFKLNRFILLGILLFSFSVPILPTVKLDDALVKGSSTVTHILSYAGADQTPTVGQEVGKFEDEVQIKRLSGLIISLFLFYACFAGFFLLRFFNQLWTVISFIKSCLPMQAEQGAYLDPGDEVQPFSFFGAVVLNAGQHEEEHLKQIIAHERAHARQWHSVDILLAEIASVILWGNPLVHALKSTLRLNLEFLADQEVLNQGFDKRQYQWSIITPYLKQQPYPLTNLYSSKPKLRIEKMNAGRSPLVNLYKYLLIIPVLAFLYIGVAPFHAAALDKIDTMHMIDNHQYRDYLGYYEFDYDKGTFVQLVMKDQELVMRTLWNNRKIRFERTSNHGFVNKQSGMTLAFPRNTNGGVEGFIAFGEDRWRKVQHYTPVEKKSGERMVISRTSSGGLQVLVCAIEPWVNVKNYIAKDLAASP